MDSDEPVQPPFKLRNSKWCSVRRLTLIEYKATSKGFAIAQTTLLEISCTGSIGILLSQIDILLSQIDILLSQIDILLSQIDILLSQIDI